MSYFALAYSKMHPLFYCGVCFRKEKDLANGCPKCELTDVFEHYKERAIEDVEELVGFPKGWTIDSLLALNGMVCGVLGRNGDRIKGKWTVTFARLAEEVQKARRQHERELNYNAEQKMKALAARSK